MLVAADGNNFSTVISSVGSGTLILNGGTLAAGPAGGSVAGLVQAGSGPHTIAPGAALSSGYGILNLNGGLSANTNTTLAFNLNQSTSSSLGGNGEPVYIGDLINLGAPGLSGSGNFTFGGVTPTTIGDYRLVGSSPSSLSGLNLGNFTLPSFSGTNDSFTLSTTVDSGYLDLVVASAATFSGSATWVSSGGSLWSSGSNWADASSLNGVPGTSLSRTADTAAFNGSSSVTAITLDVNPSLAALSFSGSNYTLNGGTLTLNNGSGTATVLVTSSTQTIASALVLASSSSFQPDAASVLNLTGPISGSGALALDGSGELVLSGSNSYTGGTYVHSGTLIATANGAIPEGSSLTVGDGAAALFASIAAPESSPLVASSHEVVAVPEPGTIALLLAALWSAAIYCRFRRPKAFGE
jgi:autotransporter-associated beta strand protein